MSKLHFTLLACSLTIAAAPLWADGRGTSYEVTVTNLTRGQQITPLLLATHRSSVQLFELGSPARPELATLAEEGDVGPLKSVLDGLDEVAATVAGTSLTDPGGSVKFEIRAPRGFDRLSVAGMLIPSNDAFVAVNAFDLSELGPRQRSMTIFAGAYDAGIERNDELCESVPGPEFEECGGPGGGAQVNEGEGFVHTHNGIHGIGDLDSAERTWLNPVAQITIQRVR